MTERRRLIKRQERQLGRGCDLRIVKVLMKDSLQSAPEEIVHGFTGAPKAHLSMSTWEETVLSGRQVLPHIMAPEKKAIFSSCISKYMLIL